MDTKDKKEEAVFTPQFKTIKHGLDPKEVLSFINRLVAENKELVNQVKHIESLKRLAEKTVVEAHEQADIIKIEMLNEANDKANSIIDEAEKKAKSESSRIIAETVARGKAEANKITAEAQLKAEHSVREKINTATQEGHAIIRAAEERAEAVRLVAEREGGKVISGAKEKAEHLLQQKIEVAEKEAQNIAREARKRAEQEALSVKQKVEEHLERSKKKAEGELREHFKSVYQEWLSSLDSVDEAAATAFAGEDKDLAVFSAELVEDIQTETTLKECHWLPSLLQEEGAKRDNTVIYEGSIELLFPTLSDLDQMLRLLGRLRGIPRLKVQNLAISPDKSILVNVFLETPTSLLAVLEAIPEVDRASGLLHDARIAAITGNAGEQSPVKRIVVTTKA
jgi:vacuolar-type H+-ATPase subunit H